MGKGIRYFVIREEQPGVYDTACECGQHGSDENVQPGVNVEYQHQTGRRQQDGCHRIGGDGVEHAPEWLGRPVCLRSSIQDVKSRTSDDGKHQDFNTEQST